jgi:predicted nucleic acid-binding protein
MAARFVLDCSVAMSWCFQDESDAYSEAVLDALHDGEAIAPALLHLEVANVLLVAERSKRLTKSASARFVALLRDLPLSLAPEAPERALREVYALARSQSLSSYDATYLDLAMREDLPLATRDGALRQAARRCQTPMFAPGE